MDHKQVKHAKVQGVKPCLLPPVDILWLSQPCDHFSCNSISVGDGQMLAALPYIRHHQPRIVLMALVKMITWKKHRQVLNEMKQELSGALQGAPNLALVFVSLKRTWALSFECDSILCFSLWLRTFFSGAPKCFG